MNLKSTSLSIGSWRLTPLDEFGEKETTSGRRTTGFGSCPIKCGNSGREAKEFYYGLNRRAWGWNLGKRLFHVNKSE